MAKIKVRRHADDPPTYDIVGLTASELLRLLNLALQDKGGEFEQSTLTTMFTDWRDGKQS